MTCIAELPHRAVIRVGGPDWATFLKGLCTARIDDLIRDSGEAMAPNEVYGAFLRPQGKMYADCRIIRQSQDEVWLDVPAGAREELLSRLTMYRLRAKVEIAALDQLVFVAFGGDLPPGFTADPRRRIVGAEFGFSFDKQATNSNAGDWAAWRIPLGLSDPGHDFGKDELYPIDANLDLLDGIDFHKGCYVGQELTSRMKRRGQIRNRILPLRHGGVLDKGAEVLDGERRCGEVLTSLPGLSLALMRLDRMAEFLTCSGRPVTAIVPDWIAPFIAPEAP